MPLVGGGAYEVRWTYSLAVEERSVEAVTGRSRMFQLSVIEACTPVRSKFLASS
jgi:hypothetical protein